MKKEKVKLTGERQIIHNKQFERKNLGYKMKAFIWVLNEPKEAVITKENTGNKGLFIIIGGS